MNDIPRAERPTGVHEDVAYPSGKRYTLQWLREADPNSIQVTAENNTDAAFKKDTREPAPSDLLLHYNYGAAAVKRWGHGQEVLQNRTNIPRPAIPAPDRAQRADQSGGGSAAARNRVEGMLDAKEEQAEWDEHDVMLFFWGNTPAAVERHRQKEDESTQNMEQWRRGVS
jgi:hypothetical protein